MTVRARLGRARALQIAMGAPVILDIEQGFLDPVSIAEREYKDGLVPITVIRPAGGANVHEGAGLGAGDGIGGGRSHQLGEIGEVALDGEHPELPGVGQGLRVTIYGNDGHIFSELIQHAATVAATAEGRVHHDPGQDGGHQVDHLLRQNRPVKVPVLVVPVLAHGQPPGRWYQ